MISRLMKYLLIFFSISFLWSCNELPVNWQRSFDSSHSTPYGTQILRKELPKLFPNSKIYNISTQVDEFLFDPPSDYTAHYIFIDEDLRYDSLDWNSILDYVYDGGSAFVALNVNNPQFENFLKVKLNKGQEHEADDQIASKISIKTKNQENSYTYQKGIGNAYFTEFDSDFTEVLGFVYVDQVKKPNFIKVYYGDGYFLLNSAPLAFTNYHMLKDNHFKYISTAFSYMEDADIYWDNHRILYRGEESANRGDFFNALSFILKEPSLRWAFYLALSMGVLYLVFNSKRRQRIMPVILPYSNYTLDFSKTLAEVYRHHSDHKALGNYKINYFLEQLRSQYNITSRETGGDFSKTLSDKSGIDLAFCQQLLHEIQVFRNKEINTKEDFFKLNQLIEIFNLKSKHYGKPIARK